MAIEIAEIANKELLNTETIKILPTKCKCGSNLVFSNSLRELICNNKKCSETLYYRCRQLCNKFEIPLTNQSLHCIIDKMTIMSPYQLLLLKDINNSGILTSFEIPEIIDCIQIIDNLRNSEIELYEVIEASGIDEISIIAKKIFENFNCIDEAYNNIEKGQVVYISEQLGLKGAASVFAVEVFNRLLDIKDELIFAETLFNIKQNDYNYINIAFADNIIPFINKGELIDYLNNTYKQFRFRIHPISTDTDILIKNNSNNLKYRDAKIINERHIEQMMNKNELELQDIGRFIDGEIKPLGSTIYIDTLDNVLNRLEEVVNT